jgi:signal transduction histidine kinase/DNA-binding response OmpR family regulator
MIQTNVPKVLIVDDQPRNLDALEAMLAPTACVGVRAESADQALLCLLRDEFAAIILDIKMPGMNGLELAKLIKQRKRSKHVPILFLTAHMLDENDALQGYGVGAVDYLSKPINPEILRSKVGVFIDLFTKTRALAELNDVLREEVAEREKAQEALRVANQELEFRVQERTAALNRAHQGVRENTERLHMAMDVARIAAWDWLLVSGHMTWSTDPEVLFGFPPGAFGPDLRMFASLHPDDKADVERAIAAALESGTYEADYRIVRPDGRLVWITERGRVVSDADGKPARVVGISRDVTAEQEAARERERLLQDARQARDEAERQSRLKDDFLATLSHELRTPMNVILGWLAILDSGKPIRDIASGVSVIRRNAELQAKLIEDLLDMNRLMAGAVRLDRHAVDASALVQGTIEGLQPTADAKGVRLTASVAPGIGQVLGDSKRLQQVLWNLVHNAVKFTSSGGHVEIRVQRADGHLQIAIQDDGRGISPEFLPHVFERFRQQDASSTRDAFGLGLGLSIAKHLVELHGGSIQASSPGVGQGATFVVEIPVAAAVKTTIASGAVQSAGRRRRPMSASAG